MKKTMYIIISVIAVAMIAGAIFYNRTFVFPTTPATQPAEGKFVIRNRANGKMIRPEGAKADDNVPAETYTPRPWTCVVWEFHPQGENTFTLENILSGKTLAAADKPAGSRVIQVPLSSNDSLAAKYNFILASNNSYRIENSSGLYLTADANETNGITHLTFSTLSETDNQKWEILKAPSRLLGPVAKK
jgi:hypothetical protein